MIAYNTRFLILPWVRVPQPGLAHSGVDGAPDAARLGADVAHPIYLLETFVDPQRFRGTYYRAANWIVVGEATGRGQDSQSKRPNRSIKQALALPLHLHRRFRQLLSQ